LQRNGVLGLDHREARIQNPIAASQALRSALFLHVPGTMARTWQKGEDVDAARLIPFKCTLKCSSCDQMDSLKDKATGFFR
jgi:hypothetical protein